jgi:hypothetical protein
MIFNKSFQNDLHKDEHAINKKVIQLYDKSTSLHSYTNTKCKFCVKLHQCRIIILHDLSINVEGIAFHSLFDTKLKCLSQYAMFHKKSGFVDSQTTN